MIRRFMHMIPNVQLRGEKKNAHCHCLIFFADEGFGPELDRCQQAADSQNTQRRRAEKIWNRGTFSNVSIMS